MINNLIGFISQYGYGGVGKYHMLLCHRGFGSDANRLLFADFDEGCICGLFISCPGSLASVLTALVVSEKSDVSGDRIKAMSLRCRKITDIVTDWECPSADDRDGSDGDAKTYL